MLSFLPARCQISLMCFRNVSLVSAELTLLVPVMRVPLSRLETVLGDLNGLKGLKDKDALEKAITAVETEKVNLFEAMTMALGVYDVGKNTVLENDPAQMYGKKTAIESPDETSEIAPTQSASDTLTSARRR